MPKKADTNKKTASSNALDPDANVDKIRDILFGGQMRDYDKRFAALEKRLTDSIDRASRDIEKRMERLDTFTRKEFDKLSEQLKAERKERVTEGKKTTSDISEYANQSEGWFADLDERLAAEGKDIRQTLLDQGSEMTNQLRTLQEQLQQELTRETSELADSRVARNDLARLLTEVATRLNKDGKPPKS